MKIYYNPNTMKLMGMASKGNPMDYPFITTTKKYHALDNLKLVEKKGEYVLEPIEPTITKKAILRKRGRDRTNQAAIKKLMEKAEKGEITLPELSQFILKYL